MLDVRIRLAGMGVTEELADIASRALFVNLLFASFVQSLSDQLEVDSVSLTFEDPISARSVACSAFTSSSILSC